MISVPQWTERISKTDIVGEDQLGIETAAANYQGDLLPGIITVTDHARYYSLYCWILWRFIRDERQERRMVNLRGAYFKRLELAHTMACTAHHLKEGSLGGVVGNQRSGVIWRESDPIHLDNHLNRYFQNSLGGFGQYYLTPMRIMGLIGEQPSQRDVYQLTERGKQLAEAYEASIGHTHYFEALQTGDVERLSYSDAAAYGEAACLCSTALGQGQDQDLLRDMLFRLEDGKAKSQHHPRQLSLALLLDMVRQSGDQPFLSTMRHALYLGEYAPGHPYEPLPALSSTYARWRYVEARQLYSNGLQILWSGFLTFLQSDDGDTGKGVTFDDFLVWINDRSLAALMDRSLVDILRDALESEDLSADWKKHHNLLAERFKFRDDALTLFNQQITNAWFTIADAVDMLLDIFLRFHDLNQNQDRVWQEMAVSTQESHRLPLRDFFQAFEGKLESRATLRDVLTWLYREYILTQHEYMAIRKLRYNGYDTFKFQYVEGRFYRPSVAYYQPLRHPALRLNNALTMLVDVGLVVVNNGIHKLTQDGGTFLNRVEELNHER